MLWPGTTALLAALAVSTAVLSAAAEQTQKRKPGSWLRVSATAYCLKGITNSGAPTRPGTVAADPRVIPLGSIIHIRGARGVPDGRYTVLDTGRGIKGREIDVYMASCRAAKRFGRQTVRVRVTAGSRASAQPGTER
jgi:peptidoglycan lytic transglycosylase